MRVSRNWPNLSSAAPFSLRIDERKDAAPRLSLQFLEGGEVNFYSCSIRLIEEELDQACDWRADVMADAWPTSLTLKKLRAVPDKRVCDALLDQNIFSGVGNIIKNEVLFRFRIHPLSRVIGLPVTKH